MNTLDPSWVALVVFLGVAVVCGIGVVIAILRDGYRRLPDRTPRDRVRDDL